MTRRSVSAAPWLLATIACWAAQSSMTIAQIVPASDGTGTTLGSPATNPNQINISGGTQAGGNLFHSFQQFGLNQNQIANFLSRPDIQNILGRVVGGNPSVIDGLIQVTGGSANLYLLNPSGILFGPNARLNVPGSFTATTATGIGFGSSDPSLGSQSWLNLFGAPNYAQLIGDPTAFKFESPQPGSIVNAGQLTVNPGQALNLLGGLVINTGTLTAPYGQITLASVPGSSLVRLSQAGSLLSLEVQPLPANPAPTDGLPPIATLPQLLTGGGLSSHATGLTIAPNGTVQLTGSGVTVPEIGGTTIVTGTLNTSLPAAAPVPTGNAQITVVGDRVALVNATLDASTPSGGGQIRIGGDYQGKGSLPNAQRTYISPDTILKADALNNGNGGRVIVWSNEVTGFYGQISAQGGPLGGDGGFVEVSSHNQLIFKGQVDTAAPQGRLGTLLLDPTNIFLATGSGDGAADGTGTFAGNPSGTAGQVLSGDTGPTTIYESELNGIAAVNSNIFLQATNNIQGSGVTIGSLTSGKTLTLDANAIFLTNFTTGGGNLVIQGTGAGSFVPSGTITTNGGSLTVASGSFYDIYANINTGGGDLTINGSGRIRTPVTFTTSGGNFTIAAPSNNGQPSNTLQVVAGSGNVSIGNTEVYTTITSANNVTFNSLSYSPDITVTNATGTVTFNGSNSINNLSLTGNNFAVNGSLNVANSFALNNSGTFTIGSSGSLTLASASFAPSGSGTLSLGGNITTAGQDITLSEATTLTNSVILSTGSGANGNVNLNSAITSTVSGSASLDVRANRSIVANSTISSSAGALNVTLNADRNADSSGAITLNSGAAINSNGGNVILGGGTSPSTTAAFGDNGSAGSVYGIQLASGSSINAGGGNVTLTGTATTNPCCFSAGVYLQGTVTTSGSGNVTITAVGGTDSLNQRGFLADTTGAGITVANGNINITGSSQGTSFNNEGIQLRYGTFLKATGSGNITLTGTGGNNNSASSGILLFDSPTPTISTASGNITLTGNTGSSATNSSGVTLSNASLTSSGGGAISITGNASSGSGNTDVVVSGTTLGSAGTGSLALTGSNLSLDGTFTSSGSQTYTGNVVLSGDTNFTSSSGNGNIQVTGTVNSDSSSRNLTVSAGSGNVSLNGAIGGTQALNTLTVNSTGTTTFGSTVNAASLVTDAGGTTQLGGNVTTTGNQTYGDNVVLNGGLTLSSTSNGTVTFNGTVNGSSSGTDLTVSTGSGNLAFNGTVGGSQALGTLTANSSGTTSFAGVNATTVTTDASGTTQLNGTITTSGNQTYGDAVVLTGTTTLNSSSGNGTISFGSTVDGNAALTANTGSGNLTFSGAVGGTQAVGTLTATSSGTTTFGSTVNATSITTDSSGTTQLNGTVTTTGSQTYGDNLTLNGNTTIDSSSGNGTITFTGTVNGSTSGTDLTVNSGSGNISLNGSIGNTQTLGNVSLNSTGTSSLNTVNAATITTNTGGTTQLNGTLTTSGNQSFGDNVVLTGNTTLNSSSGNGAIAFSGTVNGNSAGTTLTTSSGSGNTTFTGTVGNTQSLGALNISSSGTTSLNGVTATTITTDASGTTQLNGTFTTTGSQTYNDPVQLTGTTNVTSSGNSVTFGSTVNGAQTLTVNASKDATFTGAVGGSNALSSLSVTANTISIDLPSVTTTGSQTYNGQLVNGLAGNINISGGFSFDNPVALVGDAVLTFTQANSTLTFANGLNGAHNLAFNSGTGSLTLGGTLGNQTPLSSVTVNGNSLTLKANISTTGSQTYNSSTTNLQGATVTSSSGDLIFNNAVTLSSASSLSANGSIRFLSTLNGTQDLALTAGNNISFGGPVGGTNPLGALRINNVTDLTGTTLSANSLFQTTGQGRIQFDQLSVNALTLNTKGAVTLGSITSGGSVAVTSQGSPLKVGTVSTTSGSVSLAGVGITTGNITTQGGSLTLTSPGGDVTTGNLNTSASSGGNITIVAGDRFTAGQINSSGTLKNGGGVSIDPRLSVTLDSINAQGGNNGIGGPVDILSLNTVQLTQSFLDRNNTLASISTAGGNGGGSITIRFGAQIPFYIGDASSNGSAGALTSAGDNSILPIVPVFVPLVQGNIRLIPINPIPNLRRRDPGLDFPDFIGDFALLNLGDIGRGNVGNALETGHTDLAIGQLDDLWAGEYGKFYGGSLSRSPQTAASMRELLLRVAQETSKKPAVVYMLVQPDRVDLVVLAGGVPTFYKPVPVTRQELLKVTKAFQSQVTDASSDDYLESAQKLYQWLIAPIEPFLQEQKIDNLVFSVDTGLRSIPLAALHDGKRFLVEKYSLGMIPSISMMDPQFASLRQAPALVMGASQFTTESPLPAVQTELTLVTQFLGNAQFFLNDTFTVDNLRSLKQRQSPRIIHLATHGEFKAGALKDSYIQFWDRPLSLTQLRLLGLNNPATDLLVFSACRTALGSDDAEFGFGGLAVQAGVRAAMGSLWYVSDLGTLGFMSEFYHQLQSSAIKSEALRQTQLAMIRGQISLSDGKLKNTTATIQLPPELAGLESPNLNHPYYWAPFTMIGNPW